MPLNVCLIDKAGVKHQVDVTPEMLAEAKQTISVVLTEILGFEVVVAPSLFATLKQSILSQWGNLTFNEMKVYLKALDLTLNDIIRGGL